MLPAGTDSGILWTYDSLGFVAAGTSWNFNGLLMGPFSDFRTAIGPTINPSNDGVTVQYTARTVNTVSVRINVPYSARKGRHQLSFPATTYAGYATTNPFFAIVVYDATPVIASVTPNPIPAGSATTLTITGTGFGDHPTVHVGGTAYNPGAPSRNPQGQDVVTFSVTLPLSQAGTPVSVYLVSNGAGGQAFFGAPQGPVQSSPTSNTVQVQVAAPATISGPNGMWWFGPDFVPNSGYYNSALLTVTAGAGGSTPTPSSPAQWTLTANSDLVSLNCTDSSCSSVVVTAQGPTVPCDYPAALVTLKVVVGGISSTEHSLAIDEPDSLEVAKNPDGTDAITDLPYQLSGDIGYETTIVYQVRSMCGQIMLHPAVNELFTAQGRYTSNNWPFVNQNDPNYDPSWSPANGRFTYDVFVDALAVADPPPLGAAPPIECGGSVIAPPPCFAGPLRSSPLPLSTIALIWQKQEFRVGSSTMGEGILVQIDYQTSYQDHGRNEGAFKPF